MITKFFILNMFLLFTKTRTKRREKSPELKIKTNLFKLLGDEISHFLVADNDGRGGEDPEGEEDHQSSPVRPEVRQTFERHERSHDRGDLVPTL